MEPWNVLSSEYVIDEYPYHRTRRDRCQLPNGMQVNAYVLEYPDWVNAIVMTPDRNLVLVRQYRHGLGDFTIETPGGMMEQGEDPSLAVAREVAEETGYRSNRPPILLGALNPNPASHANRVIGYLLLDATAISEQHLDHTEDIEIMVVPFDDFGDMIEGGQVPQLFTVTWYYLVKEYLHRLHDHERTAVPKTPTP